jgi:hypothetical protein
MSESIYHLARQENLSQLRSNRYNTEINTCGFVCFGCAQILGIVFFGGGLFLKFGQTILMSALSPMLSSALAQASAAGVSVGSISDFGGIFDIAAYVLIALGAFSLVVAVLGCAGACCSVKVLLAIVSTCLWTYETS